MGKFPWQGGKIINTGIVTKTDCLGLEAAAQWLNLPLNTRFGLTMNYENGYVSVEHKNQLLSFLKEEYDLDFTHYSEASVRRRIAKILSTLKLRDVSDYMELLRDENYGINKFLDQFTVNVTEMFRDPYSYKFLAEEVLPVFKFKEKIKIWSAGCSTGEEVLALTILLDEAGLLERCEIIATDISDSILQQARQATYQLRHVKAYDQAYLEAGGKKQLSDYYQTSGEYAIFDQRLLSKVDFRQHNLLDPPMNGGFDLISCRNVLIYFDSHLQNKVLAKFNRALTEKGFLMIGSKENVLFYEERSSLRETQHDIRIYQKV